MNNKGVVQHLLRRKSLRIAKPERSRTEVFDLWYMNLVRIKRIDNKRIRKDKLMSADIKLSDKLGGQTVEVDRQQST